MIGSLEARDPVGLFVAGRQHDDREARAGADAPADLEPVHPRQPKVEHDETHRVTRELCQRLLAGAHGDDPMAVALQRDPHHVADVDLVLDDEHRAHPGPSLSAPRPSAATIAATLGGARRQLVTIVSEPCKTCGPGCARARPQRARAWGIW
jgi:hypothetical protein